MSNSGDVMARMGPQTQSPGASAPLFGRSGSSNIFEHIGNEKSPFGQMCLKMFNIFSATSVISGMLQSYSLGAFFELNKITQNSPGAILNPDKKAAGIFNNQGKGR